MMYQNTILLIDDEKLVLRALERLFRNDSYLVLSAGSAERGLELLDEMSVDLVICDHRMPGMNGLEFFKLASQKYPETVRILMTGFADLEMALEAINNCDLYKFFLKPWNNDELLLTVRRALEHREAIRSRESVSAELHRVESTLHALEEKYPGITQTPEDGIYRL